MPLLRLSGFVLYPVIMRTSRSLLLVTTLLSASASMAQAQPARPSSAQRATSGTDQFRIDKARINAMLASMVAKGRAVGVSALVWQDGAERYFGAAGYADREVKRAMSRDALVQIYSMTKPVTGVALMRLWEQGKFGLDEPLSRYLPEFANMRVYGGKDAAGAPIYRTPVRPILIRDILRHTAGFTYGWGDTPVDDAYRAEAPLALTNDLSEMGRKLARVPLLHDPGERWHYSAAVDVQALLVEKLSGEPFEAHVRRTLFEPLRMRDTAWTQPPAREARLAATYARGADGRLARQADATTRALNFGPKRLTQGGSGIASTIDDYMRFARMLLGGGALDGVRILKASTVRLMATDQLDPRMTERQILADKGGVGFGFDFAVRVAQPRNPTESRGTIGEFSWDGYPSTLFWVDPVNRMTVVFLTQTLPFDGTLHRDIREAVYGAGYLGPEN